MNTPFDITDISLVGTGAVGKGTLARGLAACQRHVHHIEMSVALHWAKLNRPNFFDSCDVDPSHTGDLYSDVCAMNCLQDYMESHEAWGGINIYDGAGRNARQVDELCTLIKFHRRQAKIVVLDLRINLDEAIRRAKKRRRDDIKKGKAPRKDDTPAIVKKRFELAEECRPSILAQYHKITPHIFKIDANGSARQKLLAAIKILKWKRFAIDSGILDP